MRRAGSGDGGGGGWRGGGVGSGRKVLIISYGFVKRDKSYDRLASAAHQKETRLERAMELKHR